MRTGAVVSLGAESAPTQPAANREAQRKAKKNGLEKHYFLSSGPLRRFSCYALERAVSQETAVLCSPAIRGIPSAVAIPIGRREAVCLGGVIGEPDHPGQQNAARQRVPLGLHLERPILNGGDDDLGVNRGQTLAIALAIVFP